MSTTMNPSSLSFTQRPVVIAAGVVMLHIGALYALQTGLLQRAAEIVVPVELLSQLIDPPKPAEPAPVPQPEKKPEPLPVQKQTTQPRAPAPPPPAPQPRAINDTTPAPQAPVGSTALPSPAPPIAAPVSPPTAAAPIEPPAAPAPAPAAAPAKVELPRSDADYLNNPPPAYPRISKSFGEQGRVMVRVYVHADGRPDPSKIEIRTSSGFERLDAAALAAVKGWRFKPGTRGGVPEGMWVNVPVNFSID